MTDFYSYNANMMAYRYKRFPEPPRPPDEAQVDNAWMQPHWVGDLTLQADLQVRNASPGASLRLELVKAGVAHRCTIDLTTGTAVVTRGDTELGQWQTPIQGTGKHHVDFANVDDRVSLTVDGRPCGGDGFAYDSSEPVPIPTAADLAPAAIAARNADVIASDLVLKRDIYYTQYPGHGRLRPGLGPELSAVARRALRLPVRSCTVSQPGKCKIIGV